jgi:DNA (cytosine-5)-methyltransferase 1
MLVGSLFSGIGGLDLGLERAGMRVVWQVENDAYCQGVLSKHWPDVRRYGDVRELTGHELAPVDLICGGFPCQPVSVAGRRLGQDDERWLWPEFARIVRVVRPRYVLVENVPGLFSRGFGDVLGDLAALGFNAEWDCLPAAAFGAPHLRYRVFLVAYASGNGRDAWRESHAAEGAGRRDADRSAIGSAVADTSGAGLALWQGSEGLRQFASTVGACQWATEPAVDRVAHGVPARVDRLRGLGNAVVPQVAEWVGRQIMERDAWC